jgi:hypothetical protein
MNTKFWSENLNGREHSENLGVEDVRINLREIGWEGVDWLQLAQVRDQWRTLVNTVINIRVP